LSPKIKKRVFLLSRTVFSQGKNGFFKNFFHSNKAGLQRKKRGNIINGFLFFLRNNAYFFVGKKFLALPSLIRNWISRQLCQNL
jgi:hypothetical protein